MAALARLSRGLRALGSGRVRAFTGFAGEQAFKIPPVKSASDPTCCYILSAYGISEFPSERFILLETFLKTNPILEEVPYDRLVSTVDINKPYRTSEKARKWVRSGFLLPHFCDAQSVSVLNPFSKGNVGVLDGLDVLCFKRLHVVMDTEVVDSTLLASNKSFTSFLKGVINEEYCSWPVTPKGLEAVMEIAESGPDYENEIIYHPEFMTDELLATYFMEYYRLLRREMPTRGMDTVALNIMKYVHFAMDGLVTDACKNNPLLRQWSRSHFQNDGTGSDRLGGLSPSEKKTFKKLERKMKTQHLLNVDSMKANLVEALVFDVHRHSQVHIIEPPVDKVAVSLPHYHSLAKNPHTWKDGVVLLHHMFPLFPHMTNRAFYVYKKWDLLGVEQRFPIPQIYEAPANAKLDEKSDPKLSITNYCSKAKAIRLPPVEEIRTILDQSVRGVLAIHSQEYAGCPSVSMVDFACDQDGSPIVAVKSSAVNAKNLSGNPKCSLMVARDPEDKTDTVITVYGDAVHVTEEQKDSVRIAYLRRHPNAFWVDFADVSFLHIKPKVVCYVSGVATALLGSGEFSASEYREAKVDPISQFSTPIISHINRNHADDTKLLVQQWTNVKVDFAYMLDVDSLGFNVKAGYDGSVLKLRIPFPRQVKDRRDVKALIVEMLQDAKATSAPAD